MGNEFVFDSSKLRERDKIVEEKHQRELRAFQQRIDKLKDRNNDLCSQLFDIRNRTSRLASSLGFYDLTEAEVAIDAAEGAVSYKECLQQNDKLERGLKEVSGVNDGLKAEAQELKEENDMLRQTADGLKKSITSKDMELLSLQEKYDALVEKEKKATERRLKDFNQWEKFKTWIFSLAEFKEGVHSREQLQQFVWTVARKKYKLASLGQFATDEELFKLVDQDEKENCPTPKTTTNNAALPTPSATDYMASSSPLAASSKSNGLSLPSNSNDITLHPRNDGLIRSYAMRLPGSSDTEDDPQDHVNSPTITNDVRAKLSSQTEEDSQSQLRWLSSPKAAKPQPSSQTTSQTEDESQTQIKWLQTPPRNKTCKTPPSSSSLPPKPVSFHPVTTSTPHPDGPARTTFDPLVDESRRRVSDIGVYPSQPIPSSPEQAEEPARKYRRVSEGNSQGSSSRGRGRYASQRSPRPNKRPGSSARRTTQKRGRSKIRENDKENEGRLDVEGSDTTVTLRRTVDLKGKGRELPLGTPKSSAPKVLDDYSAYKGRGRYGRNSSSSNQDKTLNEVFAIDPDRNNGLSHQYDEVVRGREQRRRMDAGDCEECRDYYEGIGSLPPRLQQPLWKSPTKPPKTHRRTCQHARKNRNNKELPNLLSDDLDFDEPDVGHSLNRTAIDSHKQAISRHRFEWARGNTPPNYWDIKFPSTQEVQDINEKAEVMHQKKRQAIEREAMSERGRYKRR